MTSNDHGSTRSPGCPNEVTLRAFEKNLYGGKDVPWHDTAGYDSRHTIGSLDDTRAYALGDDPTVDHERPTIRVLPFPARQ